MPIESVLYTDWIGGIPNIHRHHSLEGYCENLPRGTVNVELSVGKCSGEKLGNAYTGWYLVSRINDRGTTAIPVARHFGKRKKTVY